MDYEQIMSDLWEQTRKKRIREEENNPNNKKGREAPNKEGQIKQEEKERDGLER